MTSVMNNSNANSALINTLNASDSRHNPAVYSSKKIYPASAMNLLGLDLSTGTFANNQTITYNLNKYGILQSLNFVYEKTDSAGGTYSEFDFMTVIDRVELLSSSRVIQTLTNHDILAQCKDLDMGQFEVVNGTMLKTRSGTATQSFSVPLVFGFMKDINTNLNLQFNEPMSVRIKLKSEIKQPAPATTTVGASPKLFMRYLAYNESDYAEVLAQNYDEPEFNQMVTNFYDEPTVSELVSAAQVTAGLKTMTVDLKNTECVNNFYVIVHKQVADTAGFGDPIEVTSIKLKASGQTLYEATGAMVFSGSLCENGYYRSIPDESSIDHIAKIGLGYWEYAGGGTQSNTLSLRELNNPQIEVTFLTGSFAAGGTETAEVIVCEETLGIVSTTSSTGRVQAALSN